MSQKRSKTQRTSIPLHIQRAVIARDGDKCRRCGVVTEFLHFDHLIPFDVGGPNTEDNIQLLCPKCNTSKGNSIQCRTCGHWMSPEKARCTQCETPLLHTKYSKTLRGRVDRIIHQIGIAALIAIVGGTVLVFGVGGSVLAIYIVRVRDSAATVNTIINESFEVSGQQGKSIKISFPPNAKNARIVGGFKVTSGASVAFYIVGEAQIEQWSNGNKMLAVMQRENVGSLKIRQPLSAGTYYVCFVGLDPNGQVNVAAELYAKYD
jgi:hypothetical protein